MSQKIVFPLTNLDNESSRVNGTISLGQWTPTTGKDTFVATVRLQGLSAGSTIEGFAVKGTFTGERNSGTPTQIDTGSTTFESGSADFPGFQFENIGLDGKSSVTMSNLEGVENFLGGTVEIVES